MHSALAWYLDLPQNTWLSTLTLTLTLTITLTLTRYLDLPQNTWLSMYELELPRAPSAALLGGEASSWGEHCDATNLQQVRAH